MHNLIWCIQPQLTREVVWLYSSILYRKSKIKIGFFKKIFYCENTMQRIKKTARILENKIFLLCNLAIFIILNPAKCHLTDGIHWMLSSIAVPTFEEDMVLRWFLENKIKFLMGRYKILIFDLNCWLTLEAVQIIF